MREEQLPAGSVPSTELKLAAGAIIIADLHLAPMGDEGSARFVQWLDGLKGPQLIIMGDLFDTWVGAKQARIQGSKAVLDGLARLAASGTHVHVIPGNRDALLDATFEKASRAQLHMEGFVGLLPGGERAAFVHGDSLCTRDLGYLKLRRAWRNRGVRLVSRHAPLWFARAIGRRLRAKSEHDKPFKLIEDKSIRPRAVAALAAATRAGAVVCGHAHEVRDEVVHGEPRDVRFVVVGAWGWESDVWNVTADGAIAPAV